MNRPRMRRALIDATVITLIAALVVGAGRLILDVGGDTLLMAWLWLGLVIVFYVAGTDR